LQISTRRISRQMRMRRRRGRRSRTRVSVSRLLRYFRHLDSRLWDVGGGREGMPRLGSRMGEDRAEDGVMTGIEDIIGVHVEEELVRYRNLS